MNILLITAHPNAKDSFTAALAARYQELVADSTHTLEVIDLYDKQWHQPYFRFDLKDDPDFRAVQARIHERITKADQLIFAHPLWWGGQPAVLKNFLDCNLTSGFAFRHKRGQSELRKRLYPLPTYRLLKGKTLKVFVTGDGQFWVYLLMGLPFLTIWALFIGVYTGLRPKSLRYFGGMMFRDRENTAKLLESIRLR